MKETQWGWDFMGAFVRECNLGIGCSCWVGLKLIGLSLSGHSLSGHSFLGHSLSGHNFSGHSLSGLWLTACSVACCACPHSFSGDYWIDALSGTCTSMNKYPSSITRQGAGHHSPVNKTGRAQFNFIFLGERSWNAA